MGDSKRMERSIDGGDFEKRWTPLAAKVIELLRFKEVIDDQFKQDWQIIVDTLRAGATPVIPLYTTEVDEVTGTQKLRRVGYSTGFHLH